MKNKVLVYCIAVSFFCWMIPFIIRLSVEIPEITVEQVEDQSIETQKIINDVIHSLSENDRKSIFITIFKNNLKVCVLNMAGGVTFGLGTLINLSINGLYSADVFVTSYNTGLSFNSILKATLPHSFELIGIWFSGGIGFYIAWNIIQVMRGKDGFTKLFYKQVGIYFLVIFFIILSAAYVEAYISL